MQTREQELQKENFTLIHRALMSENLETIEFKTKTKDVLIHDLTYRMLKDFSVKFLDRLWFSSDKGTKYATVVGFNRKNNCIGLLTDEDLNGYSPVRYFSLEKFSKLKKGIIFSPKDELKKIQQSIIEHALKNKKDTPPPCDLLNEKIAGKYVGTNEPESPHYINSAIAKVISESEKQSLLNLIKKLAIKEIQFSGNNKLELSIDEEQLKPYGFQFMNRVKFENIYTLGGKQLHNKTATIIGVGLNNKNERKLWALLDDDETCNFAFLGDSVTKLKDCVIDDKFVHPELRKILYQLKMDYEYSAAKKIQQQENQFIEEHSEKLTEDLSIKTELEQLKLQIIALEDKLAKVKSENQELKFENKTLKEKVQKYESFNPFSSQSSESEENVGEELQELSSATSEKMQQSTTANARRGFLLSKLTFMASKVGMISPPSNVGPQRQDEENHFTL